MCYVDLTIGCSHNGRACWLLTVAEAERLPEAVNGEKGGKRHDILQVRASLFGISDNGS